MTALTIAEQDRLADLETIITTGLATFQEVGTALMEIRDLRLYRVTHASFSDYLRERWSMSRRQSGYLITACEISKDIQDGEQVGTIVPTSSHESNVIPLAERKGRKDTKDGLRVGTIVPTPVHESQVRPLAALPREDRKDAWREASETSKGKPTAKAVKAVVDRRLGKSQVNGKHVADPPDIARARKNGQIPADAVVQITEPEEECDVVEVVVEEMEERAAIKAEISDEDWLASLPLSGKLTGPCLKTYHADALAFRHLESARKTFAHHASRVFNASRRKGAYLWHLKMFLGLDGPEKWLLCPTPENGGCSGSGQVPLVGYCPHCHGRGYWLNRR